jgi:hypothetical protein
MWTPPRGGRGHDLPRYRQKVIITKIKAGTIILALVDSVCPRKNLTAWRSVATKSP